MIGALGIAAALLVGVDVRRVALLGAAFYLPVVVLCLVGLGFLVSRRHRESPAAVFCDSVAAELRAGAPLRDALGSAIVSVRGPGDEAVGVGSLTEAVAAVGSEFDDVGRELELTITAAARSGGASADLFDEIASVAIAKSEIAHEVRVASAPARATALIFVGAPVIFLGFRARGDALAQLLATPAQRLVGLIGIGLLLLGLAAAVLTLRGAR